MENEQNYSHPDTNSHSFQDSEFVNTLLTQDIDTLEESLLEIAPNNESLEQELREFERDSSEQCAQFTRIDKVDHFEKRGNKNTFYKNNNPSSNSKKPPLSIFIDNNQHKNNVFSKEEHNKMKKAFLLFDESRTAHTGQNIGLMNGTHNSCISPAGQKTMKNRSTKNQENGKQDILTPANQNEDKFKNGRRRNVKNQNELNNIFLQTKRDDEEVVNFDSVVNIGDKFEEIKRRISGISGGTDKQCKQYTIVINKSAEKSAELPTPVAAAVVATEMKKTEDIRLREAQNKLREAQNQLDRINSAQSEYGTQTETIFGKSEESINYFEREFHKLHNTFLDYRRDNDSIILEKDAIISSLRTELNLKTEKLIRQQYMNSQQQIVNNAIGAAKSGSNLGCTLGFSDVRTKSCGIFENAEEPIVIRKRLDLDDESDQKKDQYWGQSQGVRQAYLKSILGEGEYRQVSEIECIFDEIMRDNTNVQELRVKYQSVLDELIRKLHQFKDSQEVLQEKLQELREGCARLTEDNEKISAEYKKQMQKLNELKDKCEKAIGERDQTCVLLNRYEKKEIVTIEQLKLEYHQKEAHLIQCQKEVETLKRQIDQLLSIVAVFDSEQENTKRMNANTLDQYIAVLSKYDNFVTFLFREYSLHDDGIISAISSLLTEILLMVNSNDLLDKYHELKHQIASIYESQKNNYGLNNQYAIPFFPQNNGQTNQMNGGTLPSQYEGSYGSGQGRQTSTFVSPFSGVNNFPSNQKSDYQLSNSSIDKNHLNGNENEDYFCGNSEENQKSEIAHLKAQLEEGRKEREQLMSERMRDFNSMKESEQRMELFKSKLEQKVIQLKEKEKQFIQMVRQLIPEMDLKDKEDIDYFEIKNQIVKRIQTDLQDTCLPREDFRQFLSDLGGSIEQVKQLSFNTNQILNNTTTMSHFPMNVLNTERSYEKSPNNYARCKTDRSTVKNIINLPLSISRTSPALVASKNSFQSFVNPFPFPSSTRSCSTQQQHQQQNQFSKIANNSVHHLTNNSFYHNGSQNGDHLQVIKCFQYEEEERNPESETQGKIQPERQLDVSNLEMDNDDNQFNYPSAEDDRQQTFGNPDTNYEDLLIAHKEWQEAIQTLTSQLQRSLKVVYDLNERNRLEQKDDSFFIELKEYLIELKVEEQLRAKYPQLDAINDLIKQQSKLNQQRQEQEDAEQQIEQDKLALRKEREDLHAYLKQKDEENEQNHIQRQMKLETCLQKQELLWKEMQRFLEQTMIEKLEMTQKNEKEKLGRFEERCLEQQIELIKTYEEKANLYREEEKEREIIYQENQRAVLHYAGALQEQQIYCKEKDKAILSLVEEIKQLELRMTNDKVKQEEEEELKELKDSLQHEQNAKLLSEYKLEQVKIVSEQSREELRKSKHIHEEKIGELMKQLHSEIQDSKTQLIKIRTEYDQKISEINEQHKHVKELEKKKRNQLHQELTSLKEKQMKESLEQKGLCDLLKQEVNRMNECMHEDNQRDDMNELGPIELIDKWREVVSREKQRLGEMIQKGKNEFEKLRELRSEDQRLVQLKEIELKSLEDRYTQWKIQYESRVKEERENQVKTIEEKNGELKQLRQEFEKQKEQANLEMCCLREKSLKFDQQAEFLSTYENKLKKYKLKLQDYKIRLQEVNQMLIEKEKEYEKQLTALNRKCESMEDHLKGDGDREKFERSLGIYEQQVKEEQNKFREQRVQFEAEIKRIRETHENQQIVMLDQTEQRVHLLQSQLEKQESIFEKQLSQVKDSLSKLARAEIEKEIMAKESEYQLKIHLLENKLCDIQTQLEQLKEKNKRNLQKKEKEKTTQEIISEQFTLLEVSLAAEQGKLIQELENNQDRLVSLHKPLQSVMDTFVLSQKKQIQDYFQQITAQSLAQEECLKNILSLLEEKGGKDTLRVTTDEGDASVRALEQQISDLKKQLSVKEVLNCKQTLQIEVLQEKLDNLKEFKKLVDSQHETRIQELTIRSQEGLAMNNDTHLSIERFRKENVEIIMKLSQLETTRNFEQTLWTQNKNDLTRDLSEMRKCVEDQGMQMQRMKDEEKRLKNEKDELRGDTDHMKEEIEHLKGEIEKMKVKTDLMGSEMVLLDKQIDRLKEENDFKSRACSQLQEKLNENESVLLKERHMMQIMKEKEKSEKLGNEINELAEEWSKNREILCTLLNGQEELNQKLLGTDNILGEESRVGKYILISEYDALRNKSEQMTKELREKDENMRQQQERYESDREYLQKKCEKQQEESDNILSEQLMRLKDKQSKYVDQLQIQFEEEKEQITSGVVILRDKINSLEQEICQLRNTISEYIRDINDRDDRIAHLEKQKKELDIGISIKDDRILQLEKNRSELDITINTKEKNLYSLDFQNKQIQRQCDDINRELKNKSDEIHMISHKKTVVEEELLNQTESYLKEKKNFQAHIQEKEEYIIGMSKQIKELDITRTKRISELENQINLLHDTLQQKQLQNKQLLEEQTIYFDNKLREKILEYDNIIKELKVQFELHLQTKEREYKSEQQTLLRKAQDEFEAKSSYQKNQFEIQTQTNLEMNQNQLETQLQLKEREYIAQLQTQECEFQTIKDSFKQALIKQQEEFNSQLREKIKEKEVENDHKMQEREEKIGQQIKEREEEIDQKMKKTEVEFVQKIKEKDEQFEQKKREREEEFVQKTREREEEFEQKTKEREEEFEQKLKIKEEEFVQNLKTKEDEFVQKLKEKEDEFNIKMKEIQDQFDIKMNEIQNEFDIKMKINEEQFDQKMKVKDEEFNKQKEITSIKEGEQNSIKKQLEELNQLLNIKQEEFTILLKVKQDEFTSQLQIQQDKFQIQLKTQQEDAQIQIQKQEKELQTQLIFKINSEKQWLSEKEEREADIKKYKEEINLLIQKQINANQQKVTFEQQLIELESYHVDQDNSIRQMISEMDQKKLEFCELSEKFKSEILRSTQLEQEKEELKDLMKKSESILLQEKNQLIDMIASQSEKYLSELNKKQEDINDKNNILSSLRQEIVEKNEIINILTSEASEKSQIVTSLQENESVVIIKLRGLLEKQQIEGEDKYNKLCELKKEEAQKLESDIQSLNGSLNKLQQELDISNSSLENQMRVTNENIMKMQSELACKNEQIQNLHSQIKQNSEDIQKLQTELNIKNVHISSLSTEIIQTSEALSNLKENLSQKTNDILKLNSQIANSDQIAETIKKEGAYKDSLLRDSSDQIESLTNQFNEATIKNQKLIADNASLIFQLEEELKHKIEIIKRIEDEKVQIAKTMEEEKVQIAKKMEDEKVQIMKTMEDEKVQITKRMEEEKVQITKAMEEEKVQIKQTMEDEKIQIKQIMEDEKVQIKQRMETEKVQIKQIMEDEKVQIMNRMEDEKVQITNRMEEEKVQIKQRMEDDKAQITKRMEDEKVQITKIMEEEKVQIKQKMEEEKVQIMKRMEDEKVQIKKRMEDEKVELAKIKEQDILKMVENQKKELTKMIEEQKMEVLKIEEVMRDEIFKLKEENISLQKIMENEKTTLSKRLENEKEYIVKQKEGELKDIRSRLEDEKRELSQKLEIEQSGRYKLSGQLGNELKEKSEQMTKLQSQLHEEQLKLSKESSINNNLCQRLSELENNERLMLQDNQELKKRIESMTTLINSKSAQLDILYGRVNVSSEETLSLSQQLEEQKDKSAKYLLQINDQNQSVQKLSQQLESAEQFIQSLKRQEIKGGKKNFGRIKKIGLLNIDQIDLFLSMYSLLVRTHPSPTIQAKFNEFNYNHIIASFQSAKKSLFSKGENRVKQLFAQIDLLKTNTSYELVSLDDILESQTNDLLSITSVQAKLVVFHDNLKIFLN